MAIATLFFEATKPRVTRSSGWQGQSVIEVALLGPWLLLLFAALFDFGIYTYAAMATANAARTAALRTAATVTDAGDQQLACLWARRELRMFYNVSQTTSCDALPLVVTAEAITGPDGSLTSRVRVTYQTPQLFPLPWLTGRLTLTRVSEVSVYR